MWFKRWYHERFVNHSNDTMTLAIANNMNKCIKRKVIRIIYDRCNDDTIVCCHRKHDWLIQRRQYNCTIESNIDEHVGDQNAIEACTFDEFVGQHHQTQVTDKNVEQSVINDTQITDINFNDHNVNGTPSNNQRTNISFVTDVNEYGNGENDSGSLSKSKDPRLRTCKLSIVPEICCNICKKTNHQTSSIDVKECFESVSNRIQVQYDSDGIVDTDEWPPKSFQQIEFLQQRINELEYFISEIENRKKCGISSCSSTSKKNHLTSGTNQSNKPCRYSDEQSSTDWVIVSIELKSFTSCESFSDDDHFGSVKESSSYVQYYTTSEYSDKKTIVTVHQYPINNLLNEQHQSYTNSSSDYGIHESHNCAVGRLLCICNLLDCNIETGTPSIDSIPTDILNTSISSCNSTSTETKMKFTSIFPSLGREYHSTDSIFIKDATVQTEFNYQLQDPCSSSKHSNVYTAQVIHNSLSSSSTNDTQKLPFKTTIKYCSTESIPEYFGLNECGDIIIHVDHIDEETGFCFLAGRKKKLYCDVPYGEEVCEKSTFSLKYAVKRFFKAMSNTICKCTGEFKLFVVQFYFIELGNSM